MTQHIVVVGAGAWGLPTALQLKQRGHRVTLIDRFDVGNPYASNAGSTRLWRLADTQVWRTRSIRDTVPAMERLGDVLGVNVFSRTGLLWRDDASIPSVIESLESIDIPYERVAADAVGEYVPGLRPDGRGGVYIDDAGVVHADRLLSHTLRAFIEAGGEYRSHTRVIRVEERTNGAMLTLGDGSELRADQVVIAAGPGTRELLATFDLQIPLQPYIEQLVYFGDPSQSPPAPELPGFIDCPTDTEPGMYAMPNGADGYKIGIDRPLRPLAHSTLGDDLDRTPSPERTRESRDRIMRSFESLQATVLREQVCTWTDSGDGDFVIGRVTPSVVLACGDSGEGFKYAAFMGEYLADIVEGGDGDAEYQHYWTPFRFTDATPRNEYGAIGRH